MQSPCLVYDLLDGRVTRAKSEAAKYPTHMDVCRDIYGIIVGKLDLMIAHKDVDGHRCDLWPDTVEFKKAIDDLSAGRVSLPNTRRIARVHSTRAQSDLPVCPLFANMVISSGSPKVEPT
jgi:hypothetical protein